MELPDGFYWQSPGNLLQYYSDVFCEKVQTILRQLAVVDGGFYTVLGEIKLRQSASNSALANWQ